MLFAIGYHYIKNSGIEKQFDTQNITANMLMILFVGMFGPMFMNTFMIMSGFFSCKSEFRVKKWLQLYGNS